MRIAILGMGAIGHVVARALEGRAGVELVRVDRTRSPLSTKEPPVDAAVVCTKTPGTPWAADVARRLLRHDGVAATIQNGLGNYETLAEAIGPGRVSLGVIYVGARVERDGSLWASGPGRVELGRPRPDSSDVTDNAAVLRRLEELAGSMRSGGMDVSLVEDPWPSVWRKLVANAALNPTTALFRLTTAEVPESPVGRPLADDLARETARVATAAGVPMTEENGVSAWRDVATRLGATITSMRQDIEAGRPTEIEAINGAVAREGRRLGVDTPVNEAITLLMNAVTGARSAS
jgi:2-dehydropantoate 2-reductase